MDPDGSGPLEGHSRCNYPSAVMSSTSRISSSSSRRAVNGMVSSDDHLATAAGVAMLLSGGSAVDAAIAANAVLTVTAPHACGLGGDLFALVHHGDPTPTALIAAGRAGAGADAAELRSEGATGLPMHGDVRSVTVPGCVDGWVALHERFGRLDLEAVLAPAIRLASGGFPPSPELSAASVILAGLPGTDDLIDGVGRARRGLVGRPGAGRQLERIAREGRHGFYGGEFGSALVELARGQLVEADLLRDHADWVPPISTRGRGIELWGPPPVSQAYVALSAWRMADALPVPDDVGSAAWPHLLAEAIYQSAFDRQDVLHEGADPRALLDDARLSARRAGISLERTAALPGPAAAGSTTYLCAVDGEGMAISLIQSNASAFGSRLVVPGTGIFLQNRGIGFSLQQGHAAELRPGARPPHTLAPLLATDDHGDLLAVLGSRGGDAQPQVTLQVLSRLVINGASPGAAVGTPRWVIANHSATAFETWGQREHRVLKVEAHAPTAWAEGLRARGHDVVGARPKDPAFGFAHLIAVDGGVLVGAADPRASVGAVSGC